MLTYSFLSGVVHLTGYLLTGDEYDSESDLDFMPGDSFAEAAESDDSFSSDDDVDEGGDNLGTSLFMGHIY